MSVQQFISHVRKEAAKANVKVVLADSPYLIADHYIRVGGYFDEENSILAVAKGKPIELWLPILAHEFSHFRQSQEHCKIWVDAVTSDGRDTTDVLFSWIRGEKMWRKNIEKCARASRMVELDCERRTVKLFSKFDLPISKRAYIQRANAYVFFYNYVLLRRRWYKIGREPYVIQEICSQMPKTLYGNYERLPKKYVELYDKYC